jgi:hypothetical protein
MFQRSGRLSPNTNRLVSWSTPALVLSGASADIARVTQNHAWFIEEQELQATALQY